MSDNNNFSKVLFRFYSNVLGEETVETMWAEIIDKEKGFYKIDNIPFYAPLIASDDIVFAEYENDEQHLIYRNTIEASGNSTVWVVITDKSKEIEGVRNVFQTLGCVTEKLNEGYFAMEVPACVDYRIVRKKLKELQQQDIVDFAEPCLSAKHQY